MGHLALVTAPVLMHKWHVLFTLHRAINFLKLLKSIENAPKNVGKIFLYTASNTQRVSWLTLKM